MIPAPRATLVCTALAALLLWAGWVALARREAREATHDATSVFLDDAPSRCGAMQSLESPSSTWVLDTRMRAAGWNVPPRPSMLPQDRASVQLVDTSHGRIAWVQTEGGGGDVGYLHWIARLEPGPLDLDHAPAARAQRAGVAAYSPYIGALGDGFFLASGAEGGTLIALDLALRTVAQRTHVAPRTDNLPALGYFVADGAGGLYFLSYGDTGARVHHVDRDLRDVVPARFYTVSGNAGEHWNPDGLSVTSREVCARLDCWRNDHSTQGGCTERYLVLDHRLAPAMRTRWGAPRSPLRPFVPQFGGLAAALALLTALALGRWFRTRALLGRATEAATIEAVDARELVLRVGDQRVTVARARVRRRFGGGPLVPGPCVVDTAARPGVAAGYRGSAPRADAPCTLATGTPAQIARRARGRLDGMLAAAFVVECALLGVAERSCHADPGADPVRYVERVGT